MVKVLLASACNYATSQIFLRTIIAADEYSAKAGGSVGAAKRHEEYHYRAIFLEKFSESG
jgi:hypothetical protein